MTYSTYLLLANLYLIAFYVFYKLLLDKETYFKLNRTYLLGAGVLSMVLPFCRSSWLYNEAVNTNVRTIVSWDNMMQPNEILPDAAVHFSITDFLVMVYAIGALFFLGKLIYNILSTHKQLSKNIPGAAYSFFGKKVIDPELPSSNIISLHEDVHIKQNHSIDVLLFELLIVLNWFNPFIHLYKKSIQDIHEFLADEESANNLDDKHAYAVLIVSNVLGVEPSVLMHGFFKKSLIKKRIYMLHKTKSKRTALLKYGMFLPLFTLAAVLSSATLNTNKKLVKIAESVDLEKSIAAVKTILPETMRAENLATTGSGPAILAPNNSKLDWTPFYKFMFDRLTFPAEAYKNEISGSTQVTFKIKNGKLSNLSNVKSLGYGCDEEVMKQILSYKGFDKSFDGGYAFTTVFAFSNGKGGLMNEEPKTIDGFTTLNKLVVIADKNKVGGNNGMVILQENGIPKKMSEESGASLNEIFVMPNPNKESNSKSLLTGVVTATKNDLYNFTSIDKQPQFPGGIGEFYKYLSNSIHYPESSVKAGEKGKVYLQFIVEKDGSLSDIEVMKGPSEALNNEAVRVTKESPKWLPGEQDKKAVRVKYNIAINFSLNDSKPKPKPLYILDGKETDTNMNNVDPNTIESIEVLRDEAAIVAYGDKGKNGVILITTKKKAAEKKEKPTIEIKGN